MTRRLSYRTVALAVLLASLSLSLTAASCNPPPTLTTRGKVLWTATQIEQRVGELQNTVIQMEVTGALPEKIALLIVTCTVSVEKTLRDLPLGWQQMIITAWTDMKRLLPPAWATNPALAAAFAAVDVILGEV
jgi:hypothetical protein